MVTYEEVGRRVRRARAELGLLQADLGRKLSRKRSHAAISDIERGKTKLDLEELAELAQVLQKPLAYFTEPTAEENTGTRVAYRRSDNVAADARQKKQSIDAFIRHVQDRTRGSDER